METLAALDTPEQIQSAMWLIRLFWLAIIVLAVYVLIRAAVRAGMGQARRDAERERRDGGGSKGLQ
jgi:hypothetical protein